MAHQALFTLAIQHSSWLANSPVLENDLACVLTSGTAFNPKDFTASAPLQALDLVPQQYYNCSAKDTSWATLKYLPPGNVTLQAIGQIADAVGTVSAPVVYVTVPASPYLVLHINASKCQQDTVTGDFQARWPSTSGTNLLQAEHCC